VREVPVTLDHEGHEHELVVTVPMGGNLPRIVPARVGLDLRWERDAWRASIGAVRTAEQDDVATFESETSGYTLVDAHLAWHRDTRGGNAWELFADASNLLDEEARPHTSFLKDLAPLPGRGIAFGARLFF
jgi:iron complex outermembrane receptor protein